MSSFLGTSRTCVRAMKQLLDDLKPNAPVLGTWPLTSQFQFQTCIIIKETLKIRPQLFKRWIALSNG